MTLKIVRGNKKYKNNFTKPIKVNELTKNSEEIIEQTFVEKLTNAVEGVYYPSESDEKIKVIDWQADNDAPFNTILFRKYIGVTPEIRVESDNWEKFFDRVLIEQEWWTDFEKERAIKFTEVKKLLSENLSNIEYLKAGRVELEAYIIGQDKDCKWKGLKTLIIET